MKEGETAGGRGDADRAEWMGEGLFVHASNSLGVISIACSIIVPFEEGTKKKKKKKRTTSKASSLSRGTVRRVSRSAIREVTGLGLTDYFRSCRLLSEYQLLL